MTANEMSKGSIWKNFEGGLYEVIGDVPPRGGLDRRPAAVGAVRGRGGVMRAWVGAALVATWLLGGSARAATVTYWDSGSGTLVTSAPGASSYLSCNVGVVSQCDSGSCSSTYHRAVGPLTGSYKFNADNSYQYSNGVFNLYNSFWRGTSSSAVTPIYPGSTYAFSGEYVWFMTSFYCSDQNCDGTCDRLMLDIYIGAAYSIIFTQPAGGGAYFFRYVRSRHRRADHSATHEHERRRALPPRRGHH